MKTIQFILLMMICLMGCKVQQPVIIKADINNGLELGGCYFSMIQNNGTKKERPFVLEIVPPKYKEVETRYSEAEIDKYSVGDGLYQFQKREPHFKFIMKDADLSNFTTVQNPTGYMYCMVEVPSGKYTLTKEKLEKLDYKLYSVEIIQHSKIIKRYVNRKPKKLKENQHYFEGGYWTEPKKAIGGDSGGGISILTVKRKLIELGYSLVENDIIDQDTKDALLDFQRKNGLKEGQLDIETLKKLDIKY